MAEKVKLRSNIIIAGLQYDRDKIINRSILRGTRFDTEEFIATSDDPFFHEAPWSDKVVVSTETSEEIAAKTMEDPMMESIVARKQRPPTDEEIVRPRIPEDESDEELELVRKPFPKRKLVKKIG